MLKFGKDLSPLEFENLMSEISDLEKRFKGLETDSAHMFSDRILCAVLKSLGYDGGVQIFIEMDKWYG